MKKPFTTKRIDKMKVVICFDTEDSVGMDNCIKIVDHLAKSYYKQRITELEETLLSKRELGQILQTFYRRHRYHDYDQTSTQKGLFDSDIEEGWSVHANFKLTRDFVDEVWNRKQAGKGFLFWSM